MRLTVAVRRPLLLDEQLADHVGDERVVQRESKSSKVEVVLLLGEVVGVAGAEDEEGDRRGR